MGALGDAAMTNRIFVAAVAALAWLLPIAAQSSNSIPTSQKVIKNPTEYSAYIHALGLKDPARKAAAFESFVAHYPHSIVKIEALEQAMAAYQRLGNAEKVQSLAGRILQIEPDDARALAIDVFIKRSEAGQGNKAASASLGPEAERGIRSVAHWSKPSGMGNAEFKNLRLQMASIFQGAAGFAALQAKDYGKAREHYRKAIRLSPNNLSDVYQLGVAELQMKPLDSAGFWHVARALKLASGKAAAQKAILRYGKAMYVRYHGSEEGWSAIVVAAAKHASPPHGFSIKPAH